MPIPWKQPLVLDNFMGGFAPGYDRITYPWFGKKNQARDMVDIIPFGDFPYLEQGTALTTIANSSSVTTTVRGIMKTSIDASINWYAVGGAKLYKATGSSIVITGGYPHTIDDPGQTGESGEDVVYYQGKVLYSYNFTGGGGLGYDNAGVFDDVYWVTTLAGTALTNNPHQLIVGGDDVLYITNGRYIATLDGTSDNDKAFDLSSSFITTSHVWSSNRLVIAANRPNFAGIANEGHIFVWNGYDASFEHDIVIKGRIVALWEEDGTIYAWWEDNGSLFHFGFLDSNKLRTIWVSLSDGFPRGYYSVASYRNIIFWVTDDSEVFMYGSIAPEVPKGVFHTMSRANIQSLGFPGLNFVVGGTNEIAVPDGISTAAIYKTLMFNASMGTWISRINKIIVFVHGAEGGDIASGARVDLTIDYYDKDGKIQTAFQPRPNSGEISFSTDGAIGRKEFYPNLTCQKFGLNFSWANGSGSNPLNIEKVIVEGEYVHYNNIL